MKEQGKYAHLSDGFRVKMPPRRGRGRIAGRSTRGLSKERCSWRSPRPRCVASSSWKAARSR